MLTPRVLGPLVVYCCCEYCVGWGRQFVKWRRHSRLALLAMTQAPTPGVTQCRLTHHGLRPMCLHCMGPGSWATLLHKLEAWLKMTPPSPSVPMRSWWGSSPSTILSMLTLMYIMWACSREYEWTSSSPPYAHDQMGKTLWVIMLRFTSLMCAFV
jgi:hypothetical protein